MEWVEVEEGAGLLNVALFLPFYSFQLNYKEKERERQKK